MLGGHTFNDFLIFLKAGRLGSSKSSGKVRFELATRWPRSGPKG